MTDMKKQQKIIEMIEQLLAGETVDDLRGAARDAGGKADSAAAAGSGSVHGKEMDRLLSLAEELGGGSPEPTAEFRQRLSAHLAELKAEGHDSEPAAAEPSRTRGERDGQNKPDWLPSWMSVPRIATVAAALVIGLGLVGMTGALIRGGYQGKTTADTDAVSQSRSVGDDSQAREKATGNTEPGLAGEVATDGATGFAAPDSAGSSGTAGGTSVAPLPSTQKIIQTADYRIEIVPGEFDEKYAKISEIAARYGGYVISGDTRMVGDELKNGGITIRVANTNDNFSKAQNEIDGLGTVTSKKISGQDVTEEYVDLQSRLRNAEAQEAQYLALMQRAQTIEEILTVQSRLSEVQSQIEQIKGRMKYMEGRTDFATITIDLRETRDGEEPEDDNGTNWGFLDSIEYAGWLAVQTLNFVIVALGVIVPLAFMSGGLALLAYRILQNRRARKDNVE
ncbi:MAG: DUF4349 domain-containing protein [Thermoleophilia bacterium]